MNPLDGTIYDSDYYLHGKQSGKSLYENYRWLPDLTVPMAQRMIDHLGIEKQDTVLDFGCAHGFIVKAFHILGHKAHGIDVSEWAIENCDEAVREYVSVGTVPFASFDWIIAKDVLEHIPNPNLAWTLEKLAASAKKGLFIVVPLSLSVGCPYVVSEYEQDITHVQRLPLPAWAQAVKRACGEDFDVEADYRIEGIKQNYAEYEKGNGFLTARRKD